MPERLVRETTSARASGETFRAAAMAPAVQPHDAALDHRPVRFETLPDSPQTELIEAAERRQVRGAKVAWSNVEVFRLGRVRTSILEGFEAYPAPTRSLPRYTLNHEEPVILLTD